MNHRSLKIALGPILYYWPREVILSFYQKIATTPVDIVYLGEAVCSRRHEMRLDDWLFIADMLTEAGKQVVLSTLVLIESGSDLTAMRKITANGRFMVEANDMGAVHCLSILGAPFVAGPHLNIYNAPALDVMAMLGAHRWVMPLEMDRKGLMHIKAESTSAMDVEVFAFGRMPLAFSARCFTARHRNLPKDDCQFSCIDYPDGLLLKTKDADQFLTLNGIQVQSARFCNLLGQFSELQDAGVHSVRISPQLQHTEELIALFDQVRQGVISPLDGYACSEQLLAGIASQSCNGYWTGQPGLDLRVTESV